MKASEIRELSIADIQAKIVAEKKALSNLKIGHSVSPLENPLVIRQARKTIARLQTELKIKESQA